MDISKNQWRSTGGMHVKLYLRWLSILLQDEFQPIVLCGLKFLMTSYDFAMLLNVWVSFFYVQHTYSRQSMIDGLIND